MQKIVTLAKLWCDYAEGFESGLRAWVLDVGDWELASGTALADAVKYTAMMNMAPIFFRNNLQLGTYAKSAALRIALLQWCCSFRNFGATPTVSAGNGTGADDGNWMQIDSLKKGKGKDKVKHQNQKKSHEQHKQYEQYRHQHVQETVAELDIGRKTAGDQVEELTTIPPVTTALQQEQQERQRQRQTSGRCGNESVL